MATRKPGAECAGQWSMGWHGDLLVGRLRRNRSRLASTFRWRGMRLRGVVVSGIRGRRAGWRRCICLTLWIVGDIAFLTHERIAGASATGRVVRNWRVDRGRLLRRQVATVVARCLRIVRRDRISRQCGKLSRRRAGWRSTVALCAVERLVCQTGTDKAPDSFVKVQSAVSFGVCLDPFRETVAKIDTVSSH